MDNTRDSPEFRFMVWLVLQQGVYEANPTLLPSSLFCVTSLKRTKRTTGLKEGKVEVEKGGFMPLVHMCGPLLASGRS